MSTTVKLFTDNHLPVMIVTGKHERSEVIILSLEIANDYKANGDSIESGNLKLAWEDVDCLGVVPVIRDKTDNKVIAQGFEAEELAAFILHRQETEKSMETAILGEE